MPKDQDKHPNPAPNREDELQAELDDDPNPLLPGDFGSIADPGSPDFETWDDRELYVLAQERGLEGYANLSRAALIEALRNR